MSRPACSMCPLRLGIQPRDGPEERRLPAARRAQEADELALVDLEGDAVEGRELTEPLGEVADAEERGAGTERPRRSSPASDRHGDARARAGPAAVGRPAPSRTRGSPRRYFFGSDFAPYRFSHSARILARFVAAHWKSFLAMCWSMLAGRCSTG